MARQLLYFFWKSDAMASSLKRAFTAHFEGYAMGIAEWPSFKYSVTLWFAYRTAERSVHQSEYQCFELALRC